ncbi:hypothetical protein M0E87_02290 [Corynebacterium sp. CCM 9185]|uniref:hypothetical protein n=1 Tax=Corynebacterium marambiense TaxID=2765364 RepID=UPI0018E6D1DF|nr:hypothetical protein [Corynebacterium marambiense]MCK7662500.1 hypothetical protein [Corynebacterium marambiense]
MLADSNQHLIESVARKQWDYWNRKQSAAWRNGCAVPNFNLVKQLEKASCPHFADHIRNFLTGLDVEEIHHSPSTQLPFRTVDSAE